MNKKWLIALIIIIIGIIGFYCLTVHSITVEDYSITKINQKDIYPDTEKEYNMYLINYNITGHNPQDLELRAVVTCQNENDTFDKFVDGFQGGGKSVPNDKDNGIVVTCPYNLTVITLKLVDNDHNVLFEKTLNSSDFKEENREETYEFPFNDDSSSTTDTSSSDASSNSFVSMVLTMYDLDKDGKLSGREWNNWCAREGYGPMSDCDTNGDGYCSKAELETYSHSFGY